MPLKLPPDARPQTGAPGHRQPRGRRQRQIPARARRQVSGQPLPATCSSPEGELRSPIVDAGPLHMHHRPRAASSRRQARLWVAREASARDEALAAPTRRGPPTSAIRWTGRRRSAAHFRFRLGRRPAVVARDRADNASGCRSRTSEAPGAQPALAGRAGLPLRCGAPARRRSRRSSAPRPNRHHGAHLRRLPVCGRSCLPATRTRANVMLAARPGTCKPNQWPVLPQWGRSGSLGTRLAPSVARRPERARDHWRHSLPLAEAEQAPASCNLSSGSLSLVWSAPCSRVSEGTLAPVDEGGGHRARGPLYLPASGRARSLRPRSMLGPLEAKVELHRRLVRDRYETGDARCGHLELAPWERERSDGCDLRA